MGEQGSNEGIPTTSKNSGLIATTTGSTIKHPKRIAQNYLLIWVDTIIDKSEQDCQDTLAQLNGVVNDINIFTDLDQCIQYLKGIDEKKAFVITSGSLGQNLVPDIHGISQLDSIYIFCSDKSSHEEWVKQWEKVKGIYTSITPICEEIQRTVTQYEQDSILADFVTMNEEASSQDLNQLEPTFMYTQIFKDILLEMEYDQQSIKDFVAYCRKGDYGSPTNITKFENEYHAHSPIWWYTFPSFISSMLNDALRLLEVDTIINMGFFIHDLHNHITQLYQQQIRDYEGKSFTVYSGQGLSTQDFEKLCKTKGGLMSFNNFLSTYRNRDVSLGFAESTLTEADMVGILFRISVDPSISFAPFAHIEDFSYLMEEEEVLFSMHTVFRIGEVIQIDKNNPLHEVELTLTSDDDQQLRTLTKHIQESECGTGWERIGNLLLHLKKLDRAEELYTLLLKQTHDENDKSLYYTNLGYVKHDQGDYDKAIWYYKRGIEIRRKTLPANHPLLATSYNNIGGVYDNMGEYFKARSFYDKALEIRQKTLPADHPDFAESYNNIGRVYYNIRENFKALSFYEKALEIRQKTLPANHPHLATSYNNIAWVYRNMGNYSKALSLYERALSIWQSSLPSNHPNLKSVRESIAFVPKRL